MNKLLLVARREFLYNLRRPAFLFSAFGSPLFVIVIMALTFSLTADTETLSETEQIGYVDQSGILADAETLDNPEFAVFLRYPSETAARAALEENKISAYFVLPAGYMTTGTVQLFNYSPASEGLKSRIDSFLRANLLLKADVGLPLAILDDPAGEMTVHIAASNRTIPQAAIFGLFLLPFLFVMIFMLASQTVSGFLMNGIVEEKTSRIMEVLVTSITPTQLLGGKIIGLGLLGLIQLLVWIAVGVTVLTIGNQQNVSFLTGLQLPADLILVALVYFLLSYFLLASVLAGVGAAAGSEQESRQYAGLFALLLFIPMFFIVPILEDPSGSLPLALSLIPVTAPMTMLMRMSLSAVPFWQIILSLLILALTTLLVAWASAKVFRWGLLLYGKRIDLRRIVGVVLRREPRMETVATQVQER